LEARATAEIGDIVQVERAYLGGLTEQNRNAGTESI
jgi:hypothetical protein